MALLSSGTEPCPAVPVTRRLARAGTFSVVATFRADELAAAADHAAALGEAVLRLDGGPVVLDHEGDADADIALFAGLGQKDDVAVELHAGAFEQEHRHERGGEVVFVVHGSAAVDVAVFEGGGEGAEGGPLGRLDVDDVRVGHDEQRLLGAIAFQARDEVRALLFKREGFDGDAFGFEHGAEVVDGGRLVAGRVGGVDADEGLEVAQGFRVDGVPVGVGRGE